MKVFEQDIVGAFRQLPTFGLVVMAEDLFRSHHPEKLKYGFVGILPSEDTPAEREATKSEPWPPDSILHLIKEVGAKMFDDFLKEVAPLMRKHLDKQVFILLTSAFDSFLDRQGFSGTLGVRYGGVKKKHTIPGELDSDT